MEDSVDMKQLKKRLAEEDYNQQQQKKRPEEEEEDYSRRKMKKKRLEEDYKHMKKKNKRPEEQMDHSLKKKKKKKTSHHEDTDRGKADTEEAGGGGATTVSIAVAGSIVENAQSSELATRLAGQIARAATIFRIDEVIVFDYKANTCVTSDMTICDTLEGNESGALFLARILQYLEIPQYLRRALIPRHHNLRHVGLLPPLDAPHHVRKHEWVPYREGVTLERNCAAGFGTFVDVGLTEAVLIEETINPGLRVTVAMGSNKSLKADCVRQAVKRSEPRERMGLYWGYTVRYASNIGDVFKGCPYKGGYDYSIGTSEHGDIIRSSNLVIPKFRHLLIAFGGLGGLEENIEEDDNLKGKEVRNIFNCYLNTCPNQGSRTIRTEEAMFISLQYFQDPVQRARNS